MADDWRMISTWMASNDIPIRTHDSESAEGIRRDVNRGWIPNWHMVLDQPSMFIVQNHEGIIEIWWKES